MADGRFRSAAAVLRQTLMGGVVLFGVAATPLTEATAEPSKADIQWAQTVLKERGFYQGRENGDFNDATRSALSAFQKKSSLPVTGRLDAATTAKLLEGRKASSTVGTLGAPRDPAKSNAQPAAAPSKPVAAPTQRISSASEAEQNLIGGISRNATGLEESPSAAPRAAIQGEALPGSVAAPTEDGPSGLFVPEWVRMTIAGVFGATLLGAAFLWWSSGRRSRGRYKPASDYEPASAARREPRLGARNDGPELRAAPPLRAGRS